MNAYQQLMNYAVPYAQPQQMMQMSSRPMFQNPVQKMQYIMQAMQNPAAFVKRAIPDLPENIANNPNMILRYMQQTRGITDSQIQEAANTPMPF